MQKIDRYKSKQTIIAGDFNIDLIKHETDTFSQNLLNLTTKHGFAQTDSSATLIRHVYTNMISKVVITSVITPDLTDHLASTISVSLDANIHNSRW